jgi:hypothetical protein
MLEIEVIERGQIRVSVAKATLQMGLRRAQLRRRGPGNVAWERRLWQELTWPDLAAATVAVEGLAWPLDDDQIWALDDDLLQTWEMAVYRLNPHWINYEPEPAEGIVRLLWEWQRQRQKAQSDDAPELPETLRLHEPEVSFRLFQLLHITGWRWPPDVLLRQPEAVMSDILALAGASAIIETMLNRKS